MRIIAGELRGRTILGPRGRSTTRPITGRVRTSLFDRLDHRGLLADTAVLDIFAGTGTLGIEALSRGAAHCLFIEQDRDALHRLKQNLDTLALSRKGDVLRTNAMRAMSLAHLPRPYADGVSVIFLDPPYALLHKEADTQRLHTLMAELARFALPGAVMCLRTEKQVHETPIENWQGPDTHRFGSQKLQLYTRPDQ